MASLDFHFVNRFRLQAKKWLNRTALRFREQAQWQEMSWQTFQQEIDRFSYALIAQHIDIQDKIGIFANKIICLVGLLLILGQCRQGRLLCRFMRQTRLNKWNIL